MTADLKTPMTSNSSPIAQNNSTRTIGKSHLANHMITKTTDLKTAREKTIRRSTENTRGDQPGSDTT
jgi:hypothetical protein